MNTESTNAITDVLSVKEHPILFSTPMVQAILEGRKTQTRRVVKPQPPTGCEDNDPIIDWCDYDNVFGWQKIYASWETKLHPDGFHSVVSPFGKVGDVLWVRETHLMCHEDDFLEGFDSRMVYKASVHDDWYKSLKEKHPHYKWKPSIFMNKTDARIWLRISNIRVERLQDISEDDAKSEGVVEGNYQDSVSCRYKFRTLWLSINGEHSWKENPWVWVIEFERIEKPRTL